MKRLLLAALLTTTAIVTPTPVQAGPAVAILGAAFASFPALGGFAIGTFSAFNSFLIRAALGLALNFLTPRPGGGRGYQVTAFGSALDHQIIYGETKIAGARVFDAATGPSNRFLHRVVVFAGHEVEEFTEVWLNDYKLTVNLTTGAVTSAQNSEETTNRFNTRVRIIARNGTDDQTVIPEMVNEIPEWSSAHRLRGLAYLYIRLRFDADVFPNGIPEITATIKGRKVHDPRDDTVAWSDNPALCLRDYLTSGFGLGAPENEIDDILVSQAANICEQDVDGDARFSCNGAFTLDASPGDIVTRMLTSMGGLLWHAQGRWRMKPAYYTSPVLSLDESDMRSGLKIQTRASRRDNFNTVRGTWRGEESNWQVTDYTPVTDSAFLAADGGAERAADIELPFTSYHTTAQRVARIALRQQREQIAVEASFGMRAFAVQVGDVVHLTNTRMGWEDKEFEVVKWTFGFTDDLALLVHMQLRETSEAIYTEAPGAVFESNNTRLPSPYFVPLVGVNASVSQQILNEKVTNFILVDVTAATPEFVDRVEVQFRETGAPEWIAVGTGELGRFEVIDVEPAIYDIRARAINTLGVKGAFFVLPEVDVSGKTTPPNDVTGLFADLSGGSVTLDWEPVPDFDLSHYIVRHAVEEVGATWANATTAAAKVPRPASEITLPVKPGTYMLRAQDKSGNRSVGYTPVVVPEGALETFATTLELDEDGVFDGTPASEVSVLTDALVLADTSSAPSEGEYVMGGALDAGSVRRFRSRIDVTTARQDSGSGLWDDIPGLFDQFPGNFDDFTGDVQFSDTDVRTRIRYTNDDPFWAVFPAPDLSFDQNDTISGSTDFDATARTQPVFAEFDLSFPASPDGVIWEQGTAPATPRGAYIGVTSGNLTFRAGDTTDLAGTTQTAKFTVDVTPFAGLSGKLWVEISRSPDRIRAWWQEDSTTAVVLLGSAVASAGFPSNQWSSANPGAIGRAEGAIPVGESDTAWAGTISSSLFWIDTEAPIAAPAWGPWQEFKAGDFFARAAQYKVVLKSVSPNVTPRVTRLRALMEFN